MRRTGVMAPLSHHTYATQRSQDIKKRLEIVLLYSTLYGIAIFVQRSALQKGRGLLKVADV